MSYLLDYSGEKMMLPEHLFDDVSDVAVASVEVISGDEILKIIRKDGSMDIFSTYSAIAGFNDGGYNIIVNGSWNRNIDRNIWDHRKTSYDFYDWD